jgi:3-deoxy-7-phosphoheptulonate synthase
MIVILKPNSSNEQIQEVLEEVQKLGYTPHPIHGELQTVVAAIGDERTHHTLESLNVLPQVERVLPVQKRYKLVSRESKPEDTVVNVDGIRIGGDNFVVMAGPCSVESEEQLMSTARAVKACGAKILRGGAYKPRTSPYEFQGLGREGLRILAAAKKETGLKIITEVLSERDVQHVCETADVLQVGARNAQNFQLLIECEKPEASVAETRHERTHRRVVARGRIHSYERKPERLAVRTRYPDFRNLYAQHPGSCRSGNRQEGISSAGCGGSKPGLR